MDARQSGSGCGEGDEAGGGGFSRLQGRGAFGTPRPEVKWQFCINQKLRPARRQVPVAEKRRFVAEAGEVFESDSYGEVR